ncbi:hypothetical protein [Acinetobacter piscicola]|uniref:hypothetical protein n=1 Tax=Acinetobacter piscicola TaxID=2006115 RepID=UPI000B7D6E44|nr:hypothetical protein [Acinetobacter piscicola]
MNLKYYIIIFYIFQIISAFFWDDLVLFVFIFSFISLLFFLGVKIKTKIELYFFNSFLIFLFFIYMSPPIFYKNDKSFSGGYVVTDSSYLNRSNNPFYIENKYILQDVSLSNKVVVSCSLFFDKCNLNATHDEVLVNYVYSCSRIHCYNYIYMVKGGGVDLGYVFFKNKYESQINIINKFMFFYLLIDLIFLTLFVVKYWRIEK